MNFLPEARTQEKKNAFTLTLFAWSPERGKEKRDGERKRTPFKERKNEILKERMKEKKERHYLKKEM